MANITIDIYGGTLENFKVNFPCLKLEVVQGNIMRFGLVLGRFAILRKKLGADYGQLLRVVFSCFQGQKII